MPKNPRIDQIRLDGGILCLDFVNTIPDRVDGTDRDNLTGIADLIYWAKKSGILQPSEMTRLEKAAHAKGKKAKEFFIDALSIRSLIYAIFQPISKGQKVKSSDLDALNVHISAYKTFIEITPTKDSFTEIWNFSGDNFLSITAPIVKSARALLLSDKLQRVKQCPNCGWLFLDTTKNGKRRWCSMEDCGSNVKALEYYYRKKKKEN
ncbi:MAG: CGNR zinc finger domain-containing protein [Chryseolinea sp.]